MRNILFIFILSFIISCSKEEDQTVIIENATIFYDPVGADNCKYSVKTESNDFYAIEQLDEKFRENNLEVKISYFITDERMNCGFDTDLPIIKIEKIEISNIQ